MKAVKWPARMSFGITAMDAALPFAQELSLSKSP